MMHLTLNYVHVHVKFVYLYWYDGILYNLSLLCVTIILVRKNCAMKWYKQLYTAASAH